MNSNVQSERRAVEVQGCRPGGTMAPPDFDTTVNPISTRGQIMPLKYYWHRRLFRPSDGPEVEGAGGAGDAGK